MPISLEAVGMLIALFVIAGGIALWKFYKMIQELKVSVQMLGESDIRDMIKDKYSKERDEMFAKLIEKTELASKVQDIRGIIKDVETASEKSVSALRSNNDKLDSFGHKLSEVNEDITESMGDLEGFMTKIKDEIDWMKDYLEQRKREREERGNLIG